MSYEIIYDKQFIKVKDSYVPMVLSGSSNCYEYGNNGKERRSRSWFPFRLSNNLFINNEIAKRYWEDSCNDIVDRNIERFTDRKNFMDEVKSSFGYYTGIYINGNRKTTYGNINGIFKTGIEKALTIEQLKEVNVNVIVKSGYISSDNKDIKPFSKVVDNEDQFFDAVKECEEYLRNTKISTTVEFSGMYDDKPKYIRRKFFPKKPKQLVKTNTIHNIITSNGTYVYKSTRGGYNYTYHKGSAKMYADINTAKAQAKRLSKRFPNTEFNIETTKLEKEILI